MGGAYPAESSQKRGVAHAAASGCWRASIARRAITARRTGADGLLWTYRLLVSCHAPRQPERRGGGGGGREEGERGVRRGGARWARRVWRQAVPTSRAMSQQTQRLLKEQDESLDVLGQGVKRVKALAGDLRTELKDQAVILDNLDDDIEQADSSMKSMRSRMQALAAQASSSERAQMSLIVCLLIILGVLTMLVLSD